MTRMQKHNACVPRIYSVYACNLMRKICTYNSVATYRDCSSERSETEAAISPPSLLELRFLFVIDTIIQLTLLIEKMKIGSDGGTCTDRKSVV